MGLDISHDCWSGSYSAFYRYRMMLATQAGIPLKVMDGFYPEFDAEPLPENMPLIDQLQKLLPQLSMHEMVQLLKKLGPNPTLPLSWSLFKPNPLIILLNHSDCDGHIALRYLTPLRNRLIQMQPTIPEDWKRANQDFIDGLAQAIAAKEPIHFS